MNNNLIELVQKALDSPPIQKVDPNGQEESPADALSQKRELMQVVIPAVLTGFYKLTRTIQGAGTVLRGNISTPWVEILFPESVDQLIANIGQYASTPSAQVRTEIQRAAVVTSVQIKAAAAATHPLTEEDIMALMKDQRTVILMSLPSALQIGSLLKDDTLDDHTNKMDGPVSGLMHSIETAFSGNPAWKGPEK